MSVFRTLVTVDVLARHLEHPDWRLFDCTYNLDDPQAGARAFRQAHLPRASHADLTRDLCAMPNGRNGRHPLPDPQAFADWLGRQGVGNDSQVVAYDDGGGPFASRLWWMLRWLGHEAVAVLDGGIHAWRAAGLPLTDQLPRPAPRTFVPQLRPTLRVDVGEVAQLAKSQPAPDGACLVDARRAERYRGEIEPLDPVAGHIPGARNRFFRDNLQPDWRFKPAAELRREFSALLGRHPADRVAHYCGSGVTGCHNLLAMEVAGLAGSRLYAGSWSEWCSDPARPVAREAAAG